MSTERIFNIKNSVNLLIFLFPLTFILGNFAINIGLTFICILGISILKKDIFDLDFNIEKILLIFFFSFLIFTTVLDIYLNNTNQNINLLNEVNFKHVDLKKFSNVSILQNIRNKNTLYETVLISANDELVDLFIKNKIKFLDISLNLKKILKMKIFAKLINQKPRHIKEILNLSKEVRLKTRNLCIK